MCIRDRPVFVVKLVSRGTIDEDILSLAKRKLELADRVSGHQGLDGSEDQAALAIEAEIKQRLAPSLLSQVRDRAGGSED